MTSIRTTANRAARDGRIGKEDLNDILKKAVDGRGITRNEADELRKVRTDLGDKFTPAALSNFDAFLSRMEEGYSRSAGVYLPDVDASNMRELFESDPRLAAMFRQSDAPLDQRHTRRLSAALREVFERPSDRGHVSIGDDDIAKLIAGATADAQGGRLINNREVKMFAALLENEWEERLPWAETWGPEREIDYDISDEGREKLNEFFAAQRIPIGQGRGPIREEMEAMIETLTDAPALDDTPDGWWSMSRFSWNVDSPFDGIDAGHRHHMTGRYDYESGKFYLQLQPIQATPDNPDRTARVYGPMRLPSDS